MGHWNHFVCKSCGYEASVSGGRDCGMMSVTQTIICHDCKKLVDVVISQLPDGPWPDVPADHKIDLRCPKRKKHKVEPWHGGGPCPKCGAPMESLGIAGFWGCGGGGGGGSKLSEQERLPNPEKASKNSDHFFRFGPLLVSNAR